MKDYFEIKTLSDCLGCNQKTSLRDNVMNPVDIILGAVDILTKIFGFGPGQKLSYADLRRLFPAQGPVTTAFVNDLAARHQADASQGNLKKLTEEYVHRNLYTFSNGKFSNLSTLPTSAEWVSIMNNFYTILENESKGITTNGGTTEAGIFGIGIVPLLLLGGLAFGFFSTPTKKRRASR